jgi:hypothetical protein
VLLQRVFRGGSSIGGEKSSLDESRGIVKETGDFKMAERVGVVLSDFRIFSDFLRESLILVAAST